MSADYRQILVLRQIQEFSYAEIAEILGISVEVVTPVLYRARQEFRSAYQSIQRGDAR